MKLFKCLVVMGIRKIIPWRNSIVIVSYARSERALLKYKRLLFQETYIDNLVLLQRLLQYFTFSQSRSHFLRHVNGLPHVAQTFSGRFCFLCITVNRFHALKGSAVVKKLSEREVDRIVEMAWEDRTPFDAITAQFGISEAETIALMRNQMKPKSWRMWRARVQGRGTKHIAKRDFEVGRHKCSRQRAITFNKISKR